MVILVNENDEIIGHMPKLEAHKVGALHRAFSVLIFNSQHELLLQQRALHKYHTPGKWANTCCSHPKDKETPLEGAQRRLDEEMGLKIDLEYIFKFKYKAPFDNGLTEHEIDYVFVGFSDKKPNINPEEVNDFKYMSIKDIQSDIIKHPEEYTPWFKIIMEKYDLHIKHLLK